MANALRFPWIPRAGGFWFSVYALAIIALTAWGCYVFSEKLMAEEALSATVRNIGLLSGGLVALGLAIWRSFVAKQQADTARRSLLNDRYYRAAESLGSDKLHIRIGAIDTLKGLAFEDPTEFGMNVATLLLEYAIWAKIQNQSKTQGVTAPEPEVFILKELQEAVRGELFSEGVDYVLANNAVHSIVGMLLYRGVIDEILHDHVRERLHRLVSAQL